jgi:S-formylglutathione hydrolase FrmB
VLYLLHGGAGDYKDWTEGGHVEELTAGLPLITVMPDAGRSAWYTDWFNNGAGGPPMWETFHIGQLLPWIDAHFPTVGARRGRAIAGLSSAGFGAMSYATRHPDLFVAAAGFSGALDTNTPPVVAGKVIDALALQDGGIPGSLFGLRETDEIRWRAHNPWDLANNLRGMTVALRTGNGDAGGTFGGGGIADPAGSALERSCYIQTVSFHKRLDALGIEHVWDYYGAGTHNYAYWTRDLQRTLPLFMNAFAQRRADPSPFSFKTVDSRYRIYGWTVSLDRPAMEFSSIDRATARGFRLSGSGTASVTTAPLYKAGKRYKVVLRGESGARRLSVRADRAGRLHVTVPLGRANALQQQFTLTGASPATRVRTVTVSISAP